MFSLNGIALDNESRGWSLQFGSEPYLGIDRRSNSFGRGQRAGYIALPSVTDRTAMPLVMRAPAADLQQLMALLDAQPLTLSLTEGTVEVVVELMAASPKNLSTAVPTVEVSVVLQLNDPSWRDVTETTAVTALAAASVVASVFPSLSAPVRDAIVRVKGNVTGLKVADSRGSYFSYPVALPAGSYLRFHSDTGRAFTTTTDTWTGGTEVTGVIVNGPGPYFLEITPTFTDPSVRTGGLTVTTDTRASSPTIEVRGKGAYLV